MRVIECAMEGKWMEEESEKIVELKRNSIKSKRKQNKGYRFKMLVPLHIDFTANPCSYKHCFHDIFLMLYNFHIKSVFQMY